MDEGQKRVHSLTTVKLAQAGLHELVHEHVSKVSDRVGAAWPVAEFCTTNEKVYSVPAMVGTVGDSDKEPLPWNHAPATAIPPLNVGVTGPEAVCVPVKPAKRMRDDGRRGTLVANVMDTVLFALGFHVLCAAEKLTTRDPNTRRG